MKCTMCYKKEAIGDDIKVCADCKKILDFYYTPPEVTEKKKVKIEKSKKRKKFLIIIMLVIVVLIFTVPRIYESNYIKNQVIKTCKEYGLEDVILTDYYRSNYYGGYDLHDWYYFVRIESKILDTMEPTKMIELDIALGGIDNLFSPTYFSNGNSYKIYPSSRKVLKNSKEIYNDYYNSSDYEREKDKNNTVIYTQEVSNTDERVECWTLAVEKVKANLKSPSTAEFPFSAVNSDVNITKSGNKYTVKSWVDAQNSFGATIRSNFTVTIEKNGNNYVVTNCTIY